MYHIFFIYSCIDEHLYRFHILVIANNAAMTILANISSRFWLQFFWINTHVFGIAGSYENSIFNFLSNIHTFFHKGCTILHSHQPCPGFQFLTYSPTLAEFFFFVVVISHSSKYAVIPHCGLICISLTIEEKKVLICLHNN